ncbi:hypothetical protein QJS83_01230 [Bdellovibrio sp. 22V]|uniref:hypothetical protein n=1 Tax=Bdellovibrio TaxID=958 RepID=UPI00254304A1|nr:hypothetical protein [Bdellovibrio sp. 22V]WII72490.1 hypothetical protein QJS83_01230 [Bdellovibrio sp. 22V]
MKWLITLIVFISSFAHAHECLQFIDNRDTAEEAYACTTNSQTLQKLQLHKVEVCIATSHDYRGDSFAHLELKWISLSQYNNEFSKADGLNEKFFDTWYSGLSFLGQDGESEFAQNNSQMLLKAYREGSKVLHQRDVLTILKLRKSDGKARLNVYNREHSYLFQEDWKQSWDLALSCEKIR